MSSPSIVCASISARISGLMFSSLTSSPPSSYILPEPEPYREAGDPVGGEVLKLHGQHPADRERGVVRVLAQRLQLALHLDGERLALVRPALEDREQIGRASCRERV